MRRLPPNSKRTDTLIPYTTLFRSHSAKSSLLENIAIAAGSEAKQLGTLAGELLQLGEGAGNIFELRQAELAAETDAEVVLENSRRFSAELAAEVDRLVGLTGDELKIGRAHV